MSLLQKILLVVLALGALALIGYFMFSASESNSLLSSESSLSGAAVLETQEFLSRLNDLGTLRLDDSLFDDQRFNSLRDFRQELIDEPTGRTNPFDPAF